jgi:ABC-type glycerol-3-phosphate transport system substrate-binding protein
MPVEMEWRHDTWEDEPDPPRAGTPRRGRWLLLLLLLVLLGGGGGTAYRVWQESRLANEIQQLLDAQEQALARGDVDAYLALFTPEPAWQAAQLQRRRQAHVLQGRRVVGVTTDGAQLSAVLAVGEGPEVLHQQAFFARRAGVLRQSPTVDAFWGGRERIGYAWGELIVPRADAAWAPAIDVAVTRTVRRYCRSGCVRLTVELADDFESTYVSNRVRLPSPRLVGLTPDGQPAAEFWNRLESEVAARLDVTTVRFGVPDEIVQAAYAALAADFNVVHAAIRVEVVTVPELASDPAAVLATVDGALLAPDAALIAQGHVRDLTAFAADPVLESGDYYAAIWDGGWWRERLWMLPLGGEVPLIFFDTGVYGNRPVPPLHWTWDEFMAEATFFAENPPAGDFTGVLLDPHDELALSRAYAATGCRGACPPLDDSRSTATAWRRALEAEKILYPTGNLTRQERDRLYWNMLSSRRRVVFWTDVPVNYEVQLLANRIGVRPFPAPSGGAPWTPLRIHAAVISDHSHRPLATWQWLRFLSQHVAQPNQRHVPARPSVAAATGYWEKLPPPVNEAIRAAFPTARPVTQ